MIFGDFPRSFGIICGKYCKNFKQNFWDFWNQLVKVLEVFCWNFEKIARKFRRNLRKIEEKIFNDSKKIKETLLRKIKVFEIDIVDMKKF